MMMQPPHHDRVRRKSGFGKHAERHVAIAHARAGIHEFFQAAAKLLASALGIELLENAQTSAEAADGDAKIVDAFGIARARSARYLKSEAAQEEQRLLSNEFLHGSVSRLHYRNRAFVDFLENRAGAFGAPLFEIDIAVRAHLQHDFPAVAQAALHAFDELCAAAIEIIGDAKNRNQKHERMALL